MRRRVGGHYLDLVAAVGNLRRVKAVSLVGDLILEQPPYVLPVSAQIEGKGQVVAIVVVRRPAHSNRGAVFESHQGCRGACVIRHVLAGRGKDDVDRRRLAAGLALGKALCIYARPRHHH